MSPPATSEGGGGGGGGGLHRRDSDRSNSSERDQQPQRKRDKEESKFGTISAATGPKEWAGKKLGSSALDKIVGCTYARIRHFAGRPPADHRASARCTDAPFVALSRDATAPKLVTNRAGSAKTLDIEGAFHQRRFTTASDGAVRGKAAAGERPLVFRQSSSGLVTDGMKLGERRKVFGVELPKLLKKEGTKIPAVIVAMVSFLEQAFSEDRKMVPYWLKLFCATQDLLTVDGVNKASSRNSTTTHDIMRMVGMLRETLERQPAHHTVVPPGTPPHFILATIKLYLMQLPKPLMPQILRVCARQRGRGDAAPLMAGRDRRSGKQATSRGFISTWTT